MDKIKEMVEMAKKLELKTIKSGESVIMKILAIEKNGQSTMIAFSNYDSKERNQLMKGLGVKLRGVMGDNLETLMLVTDSYMAKGHVDTDKMSLAEQIIMSDMTTGKRRLEDLPPELHKYRYEALVIVVSEDQGKKITLTTVPHSIKNGELVFGKEDSSYRDHEDNMLSNVWKGYLL